MRKIRVISVMLAILMLAISPISAYTVPDDYLYVNVTDSKLGDITIYLPVNQDIKFSSRVNTDIINVGSSNVTGYFTYNGNDYTITFQPYQLGRYRFGNNYDYEYLDIISIGNRNLEFYSDDFSYFNQNFNMIILVLSFVEVFSLWMLLFYRR